MEDINVEITYNIQAVEIDGTDNGSVCASFAGVIYEHPIHADIPMAEAREMAEEVREEEPTISDIEENWNCLSI